MKRISKEENREDKRLMLERFKTIYMGGTGEIVEKKSRFIATVRLTETEEEALTFIEAVRKKYWNATHNCYAYVIGERKELVRASDDGEPQGTAGHPMLDVLQGEDLYNVTVVVTRYFGGTLLGTGGLVRAYGAAVKEGLKNSGVVTMRYGTRLQVTADYPDVGRIQHLEAKEGIAQESAEYGVNVRFVLAFPAEEEERICRSITESTDARAEIEILSHGYYVDRG